MRPRKRTAYRPPLARGWGSALVLAFLPFLLAFAMTRGASMSVVPTNTWVDLYSGASTAAGLPAPVGAYVAVFDPQGVQCGEFTVRQAGQFGLLPCYGDDPTSPLDEGAQPGDVLYFAINGQPAASRAVTLNATPVPPGTVVTWVTSGVRWQVDLAMPPLPAAAARLDGSALRLRWQHTAPEVATYEIWRSLRPYFAPDDLDAALQATVAAAGGELTWTDPENTGEPGTAYFYRVRSLSVGGQVMGFSQVTGRFNYAVQ